MSLIIFETRQQHFEHQTRSFLLLFSLRTTSIVRSDIV